MKNNDETIDTKSDNATATTVETEQHEEPETYKELYVKEHKKAQVLLISSAIFLGLFLISLTFGLRVASQDDRMPGAMQPQSMRGFYDRQGRGGADYR